MEGDWSSQSNWTIASGSVRDCITFHSSLSFSDHHATQSTPTPLLLHPPSPHHSPPCQIKITFPEKHELRQIYVRSTARVYEIYYAPDSRSNDDYLCTVRCGVAVRDDVVLSSPSVPHLTDDSVKMEDDWVEVKVPDVAKHSAKTSQDLYEATAEIDDANPCISVTLRLLSLQNKGCVYVDEIYVFADPVDSADTESQESHNENTSGSSLMAMFLPTLMQLSKTKGLSNLNALRKENQHVLGNDLEATHPSDSVIKTQLKGEATITDPQEVKLNEVQECNINSVPMQVAISESNPGDSLGGNVERVLEQLVSRMDRIEEICLGFQEKMVLPMNSIEARLQRVEQQLDTLTKKSQNSTLPSCSRIFAPDASCSDSDAISCDNCPDYAATKESESDEKHLHTEVRYVSAHISDSANTTQLLPGLVVTAPEFPDGLEADKDEEVDASGLEADEDEEVDASGPETDSSKNKAKQSIDDALSSALANFLSSTPLNSPKYTKSLTVKAPEFLNEDADDHESNSQIVKNDSVHLTDREEFGHIQVLASSNTSLENSEKINPDSNDKNSENTSQEAEEHDQFCSAEGDQDEATLKTTEHSPKADVVDNFEEDKNGKINGTELTVASEVSRKTHENIIENVLGFSLASSIVDFENPILDVKFISQRTPATESFLEDFLVETQEAKESNGDFPVLKSNGDLSVEEQSNLISIEDGELVNPTSDSHFAVDKDLCTSIAAEPVNIEGDNLPVLEDHKRKRDQMSSSLI
uniref:Uncharacterized protein n=1 Tax=Cajanus cajan TaxID=3821 RepID=A0A151TLJ7_CAJCA|nr:hypothetical protein KK1_021547 [Cajanus cajan]